jgi:hypothetical protein
MTEEASETREIPWASPGRELWEIGDKKTRANAKILTTKKSANAHSFKGTISPELFMNLTLRHIQLALTGRRKDFFVGPHCNCANFKSLLTRCENRGENYLQEGTRRCRETGGVKKQQHPECPAFKLSLCHTHVSRWQLDIRARSSNIPPERSS